jgi:hypothetical protein
VRNFDRCDDNSVLDNNRYGRTRLQERREKRKCIELIGKGKTVYFNKPIKK